MLRLSRGKRCDRRDNEVAHTSDILLYRPIIASVPTVYKSMNVLGSWLSPFLRQVV